MRQKEKQKYTKETKRKNIRTGGLASTLKASARAACSLETFDNNIVLHGNDDIAHVSGDALDFPKNYEVIVLARSLGPHF